MIELKMEILSTKMIASMCRSAGVGKEACVRDLVWGMCVLEHVVTRQHKANAFFP